MTLAPKISKIKKRVQGSKAAKVGLTTSGRTDLHVGDTVVEGDRQGTPAIVKRLKSRRSK